MNGLRANIMRTKKKLLQARREYNPFRFDTLSYITGWPFTTPSERRIAYNAIESAKRWANKDQYTKESEILRLESLLESLLQQEAEVESKLRLTCKKRFIPKNKQDVSTCSEQNNESYTNGFQNE